MKKTLLLSLLYVALAANAQTTLLEESFDTWTAGSGMVDNDPSNWALWPGGDDQVVSTDFAASGTQSLACISTNAADGGPGDLLLLLGDRTTGIYDLGWSMLIPADKGGYFNLQHAEDVGSTGSFGLEVQFANGIVRAIAAGDTATGEYVPGEWLDILINVDLDNSGAVIFVNSSPLTTWPLEFDTGGDAVTPQLGAIDFYSYGDGTALGEYYIDDVTYVQTSAGGIGMAEIAQNEVRVFPNPALDAVSVVLPNGSSPRVTVRLVDITGQQVAEPIRAATRSMSFRTEGLAPGVYFVRIDDGDYHRVERLNKL